MDAISVVGCVAIAIVCTAHMIRPVSRAEKAHLLDMAKGDPKSEELADRMAAKKWLMWTQYDGAKQIIERRRAKAEDDALIAESAARKAVRDAQRKS